MFTTNHVYPTLLLTISICPCIQAAISFLWTSEYWNLNIKPRLESRLDLNHPLSVFIPCYHTDWYEKSALHYHATVKSCWQQKQTWCSLRGITFTQAAFMLKLVGVKWHFMVSRHADSFICPGFEICLTFLPLTQRSGGHWNLVCAAHSS